MSIQDELHRIADRAPTAEVDLDTWRRARRARARDRIAVLTAAVVVVLLAVGLIWLPTRDDAPIADTDSLGLPDHLYAPKGAQTISSDLDLGTAAAAWAEGTSRIVVVCADGRYHLVEPAGFDDLFMTGHAAALSPDGTQLAYAWADANDGRTGVRVADLTTGDVREIPLAGSIGVEQLAWSPNSRWLAWWGIPVTWQDGSYTGGADRVAGRIAAGATSSEDVGAVPGDANLGLAVSPGGTILFASTNGLVRSRPGWRDPVRHAFGRVSSTGVVDLATGVLAYGVGGTGPVDRPRPGTVAVQVIPATGDQRPLRDADADRLESSPLGFVGTDLAVAVSPIDADGVHGDRRIELVGPGHAPRRVVELEDTVPFDLTVATDLMTPDRPTVHRPEPDWPTSLVSARNIAIALAASVLLVLSLLVLLVRRRRRVGTYDA